MSNSPPSPETEEEYERQREALIEDAKAERESVEADKDALVESLKDDGGETIETTATLAGGETYELRANTQGDWFDEMLAVQEKLEGLETGAISATAVRSEVPQDVARILADITAAEEYDRAYWLAVYEATNLQALGSLMERAGEALSDAMERRRGAVDGFRERSGRKDVRDGERNARDAPKGPPRTPRD